MSDVQGIQGTPVSFGRAARDLSHLPNLAPDLCRSYQWPFHIRVHPDEWEVVDGKWRICVERVHLRPGAGGVGGKNGDVNSINDIGLLQDWSKVGDHRWEVLRSGENRLRDVIDGGNFMCRARVASAGREGDILHARWERVTEDGQIVTDEAALHDFSVKLAKAVFGLSGPTRAAERKVAQKLTRLRNQLLSSAGSSRTPGGSVQLRKRILRVSKLLAFITRDESYLDDIDLMGSDKSEKQVKVKVKPAKPAKADKEATSLDDKEATALAALAAQFGGAEKLKAALAALAAQGTEEVADG